MSVVLDRAVEVAVDPGVRITEEDERRYYEQHASLKYAGRPMREVQEALTRDVYAQKFDQAYQGWRKRMRAGVRLRYLRGVEASRSPGGALGP